MYFQKLRRYCISKETKIHLAKILFSYVPTLTKVFSFFTFSISSQSLTDYISKELYLLLSDPSPSTDDAIYHVFRVLLQKSVPLRIARQIVCIANDDQSVPGPRDRDVDPIVLLDEVAGPGAHHGHEYDVKLSSLRAIDRNDLILHAVFGEPIRDCVLLGVIGSDHKDATFLESLLWYARDLFMDLLALCELLYTKICHIRSGLYLLKVDKRSALDLLLSILHIDEQERLGRVQEHLLDVALIATLDLIVVK